MAAGGYCKLPGGNVVVAMNLPSPASPGSVRVLVHARNRARALTRLRNLGLRAVYLRGNAEPPTPDEVTAVLHHPDGLIWRAAQQPPHRDVHPRPYLVSQRRPGTQPAPQPSTDSQPELWHPIRTLLPRPVRP
ncbi:hypothetical protein [Streptomyces sp. NPDC058045]|uniref:hypothetical protein n=1 Tax=Streptomyces sp. NPDC058045 TaxID=3346311 RepID=UPI0036E05E14